VTELTKDSIPSSKKTTKPASNTSENNLHSGLRKTLHDAKKKSRVNLPYRCSIKTNFQSKYDLNGSFSWLTQKQSATLENILAKYGRN